MLWSVDGVRAEACRAPRPNLYRSGGEVRAAIMNETELAEGMRLHAEAHAAAEAPARVEAARRSNMHLFRAGLRQDDPRVGMNYYLCATGMFDQREWHEAAILAELSLRALTGWTREGATAGRGRALLLLARALDRHGAKDRAREFMDELGANRSQWACDAELASEIEAYERKRDQGGRG